MKIAVISDIHANIAAFQAVLDDIAGQEIDKIFCTGDLVGYAPFPNEVIALIRSQKIPTVIGNYDDGVGSMRFVCGCDYKDEKALELGEKSLAWTQEHTSETNKEFLRNLPKEIRIRIGNQKVLLVHGSPNRLNEYISEDTPLNYMAELIEQADTDILILGHTHKPFHKSIGGKYLVNAGSVGRPKHGDPQAAYVVISFKEKVEVEIRKVLYDFEATAKAIEESDLPDEFAEMIRLGSVD